MRKQRKLRTLRHHLPRSRLLVLLRLQNVNLERPTAIGGRGARVVFVWAGACAVVVGCGGDLGVGE